ncbi:MAG: hypothetical protein K2N29_02005, partial [Ruminiclostridium sp.]|nr:hypothetical protein [Ruminiclostridium sp.]
MGITEKIEGAMNKLENKTDELTQKAKEQLTPEKRAEYKQKFDGAVGKLENKTDELTKKAKEKLDEALTDEK